MRWGGENDSYYIPSPTEPHQATILSQGINSPAMSWGRGEAEMNELSITRKRSDPAKWTWGETINAVNDMAEALSMIACGEVETAEPTRIFAASALRNVGLYAGEADDLP